jgi:hypothetical protein
MKLYPILLVLGFAANQHASAQAPPRATMPTKDAVERKLLTLEGQTVLDDESTRCDGKPGLHSRQLLRLPFLPQGVLLATAAIELIESRERAEWMPLASFGFTEESDKQAVRVQMHYEKSRPKEVHFTIEHNTGFGVEHEFVLSMPAQADAVPLLMQWSPDDTMTVVVAGKRTVIKDVGFTPTILEIGCSTGRFEFSSLSLHSD